MMTPRDDLILAALEDIRSDVREVKEQTTITNGRVTKLELWRAGIEAVANVHSWRWPAFVAVICSLASGVAVALIAAALH